MIYYPEYVSELLHIKKESLRGLPIISVFELEAKNYKYGEKEYCSIIQKQIKNTIEFTKWCIEEDESNGVPVYSPFDNIPDFDRGLPRSQYQVRTLGSIDCPYDYIQFDSENEEKLLNELREYIANRIALLLSDGEKEHKNIYGLDGKYTDETNGAIFDRLVEKGWFKGEKSHFVAIFRPEPLPVGWKPIEYINNGKPPTISALGTLIKELAPEVGYATIWNGYFTHEGKEIDIPTNNRDSKKVKQKLKGIKTKAKI